jgi:hypothetical protein
MGATGLTVGFAIGLAIGPTGFGASANAKIDIDTRNDAASDTLISGKLCADELNCANACAINARRLSGT